jgi:hypothetical protein
MTEDTNQLFDAYIDQKFGGRFRTEGCTGVRNLEQLCEGLGYRHGQFIGQHYIANFLADNPGAVELLFEFIQNGVEQSEEWRENLDLESYSEDAVPRIEFSVDDDCMSAAQ